MIMFQSPGDLSDTCELPRYQEILQVETLRNMRGEGNGMEIPAPVLFYYLCLHNPLEEERLGTLHFKKCIYVEY